MPSTRTKTMTDYVVCTLTWSPVLTFYGNRKVWYKKHNVANDGTETEYEVQEESLCYHVLVILVNI